MIKCFAIYNLYVEIGEVMLNKNYYKAENLEQEYLVSLIIPMYNVQEYIDECLNSVLNQTYKKIEIICVDDASCDRTVLHIETLKKKDDRITLLQNESTRGPAYSRNKGLEFATGEYIYFLDADDYIVEDAIESLVFLADKYKTECIFFDSYLQLESRMLGTTNLEYGLENIDKKVMEGQELFTIMINEDVFFGGVWRQFWEREYLLENEIRFEDRLSSCEDTPFTIHAILQGKHMMVVNKKYHVYRKHDGTLISDGAPRKSIALFQAYCLVLKELLNSRYDRNTKFALEKKCQQLLRSSRSMYMRNRFQITESDFADDFERHLFGYLIEGKDNNLLEIDQAVVSKIRSYSKIIIYGDSRYAMDILHTMEELSINVFGFAVTDQSGKGSDIAGIRLKEIQKYKEDRNEAIVLLGVTDQKNKTDILKTLDSYGFSNYIDLEEVKTSTVLFN